VEFIQVTGDVRREMSLCRECALSLGVRAQVEAFQRLSQLLMQPPSPADLPDEMRAALAAKCSACGYVFEEFINTGLLGCPQCYHDFESLLRPVLRRLHGVIRQAADEVGETPPRASDSHVAGATMPMASREDLEAELQLALIEENYEKAAILRDRLRELSRTSPGSDSSGV